MRRKQILSLMIVMSLGLGMVGCGGESSAQNQNVAANGSETVSESEEIATKDAEVGETIATEKPIEIQLPECYKGKTFDEFTEYLLADYLTSGPHENIGYVSDYQGEYIKEMSDEGKDVYYEYIFDNRALDNIYGYKTVTFEDIRQAAYSNDRINDDTKEIICDFAKAMMEYYPEIDMRNFCESLKLLDVEYQNAADFDKNIMATYQHGTNTIKLPNGLKYDENTNDIMIFRHELGHMISSRYFKKVEADLSIHAYKALFKGPDNYGEFDDEVLNTFITSDPFMDRYDDSTVYGLGYMLAANPCRVLFKLLPEEVYVENLIKNNVYHFEEWFDNNYSGDLVASEYFALMQEIYDDVNAGQTDDASEKLRKIYHFVAENVVDKAVTDDMSPEMIEELKDTVKARFMKGTERVEESNVTVQGAIDEVDKVFESKLLP